MDYIINPMWFYWLQVLNTIKIITAVIAVLGLVLSAIFIIWWAIVKKEANFQLAQYGEKDRDYTEAITTLKLIKKIIIPLIIVTTITGLVTIFIPSKETTMSIMIAKFATKTNAQLTLDAVKGAVDYIINGIKQIKG